MTPGKVIATLTIASGQTDSNVLDYADMRMYDGLVVGAPAVLSETVNPKVSFDKSTYRILRSGGTAIAHSAGAADVIRVIPGMAFKLVATSAVGADRAFEIYAYRRD